MTPMSIIPRPDSVHPHAGLLPGPPPLSAQDLQAGLHTNEGWAWVALFRSTLASVLRAFGDPSGPPSHSALLGPGVKGP